MFFKPPRPDCVFSLFESGASQRLLVREGMTITRRALHFPLVDTSSRLPAGLVLAVSGGPGPALRPRLTSKSQDTWTCHSGSCSEATR